jgi:hypothetical protein
VSELGVHLLLLGFGHWREREEFPYSVISFGGSGSE